MYKFFAQPLFLGKKIVFLPECHSTNDELMTRLSSEELVDGMVVYSGHQTKGKGQQGNKWLSEPGKNLLMSFYIKPVYVSIQKQFLLNIIAGLGAIKSLKRYLGEEKLSLKWPNDVYVSHKKIGGILIENTLRGNKLDSSVIGMGINLNQEFFEEPRATSLRIERKDEVDIDFFLEELLVDIEYYLLKLKNGKEEELISSYDGHIYQKGVMSIYHDLKGGFKGTITGIDDTGRLLMDREGNLVSYGTKEVEFRKAH